MWQPHILSDTSARHVESPHVRLKYVLYVLCILGQVCYILTSKLGYQLNYTWQARQMQQNATIETLTKATKPEFSHNRLTRF